jgi:hypothetical protein
LIRIALGAQQVKKNKFFTDQILGKTMNFRWKTGGRMGEIGVMVGEYADLVSTVVETQKPYPRTFPRLRESLNL